MAGSCSLETLLPGKIPGGVELARAMAAIAASVPVQAPGAHVDTLGLHPVIALLAGVIGVAAVFNLRT